MGSGGQILGPLASLGGDALSVATMNPLPAMIGNTVSGMSSQGGGSSSPPPQATPLTHTQGTPVAPITVPAVGITGPLGSKIPPAILALLSRMSPGSMG
jgi:hypothetical protein